VRHFTAYLTNGPDGACRIKLSGEFDFAGRPVADDVMEGINGARKVVLDLSELEFIDSMGIHFVVTAHERAQREGRAFTIIRGGPQVTRVFSLVGLDDVLPFADAA
jgi:anti-sigma B factor antagonist